MISTWITVNTFSCQLLYVNGEIEHSCWVSISFIWTRVTAADFDLQQSPYATPLLTPALLPIGGVRHKILTRSMRFLRTPPTGNHSRGEERGRYEGDVRSRDEREENQEILQSQHLFCWDRVRKKWERSWHETNECLQWLSLKHCWRDLLKMQAFPAHTFVVVKHRNKRLEQLLEIPSIPIFTLKKNAANILIKTTVLADASNVYRMAISH